jgi:hypothetical protein
MLVGTVQNLVARELAPEICSPLQLVNNTFLTFIDRFTVSGYFHLMTKTETISAFVNQNRKL